MQVRSTDWHVRLTRTVFSKEYKPKNLCSHFWATVGATIALAMLAAVCIAIVSAIIFGAFLIVRLIGSALDVPMVTALIVILGSMAGILVLGVLTWFGGGWLAGVNWPSLPTSEPRKERKPKPERERKTRGESLLWAFLRAKKQKVCPMIEILDESEEAR